VSAAPAEETQVHTRLLKCALDVTDSRAYWSHRNGAPAPTGEEAFSGYWFGAKSLARVEVLLTNLRARFDGHPEALRVLHGWAHMSPEVRPLICHWHLQLADVLYRRFTGEYLVERRGAGRGAVTRDLVVGWVADQGPGRWTLATRIQFASKLLSSAAAAGLVGSRRDPRPLVVPRVPDEALEYLLYLLRGVAFEGTLLSNPYLASVGLAGLDLEVRLRGLGGLRFQRQGDLIDFGWRYETLTQWAAATVLGAAASAGVHHE
jgi:hypothetical protein